MERNYLPVPTHDTTMVDDDGERDGGLDSRAAERLSFARGSNGFYLGWPGKLCAQVFAETRRNRNERLTDIKINAISGAASARGTHSGYMCIYTPLPPRKKVNLVHGRLRGEQPLRAPHRKPTGLNYF